MYHYSASVVNIYKMKVIQILATGYALVAGSRSGESGSSPKEYTQQLAMLLASGDPTIEELDALTKGLFLSPEYHHVIRTDRMGETEFSELVDSIAPSQQDVDSRNRENANAAYEPISTFDIDLSGGPTPQVDSVPKREVAGAPKLRVAGGPLSKADGTSILVNAPVTIESSTQSLQYIVKTIDTLSHLMLVFNRIDADINAQNYVTLLKDLDEEFNPVLAKLANEAIDRLVKSDSTAAKWKDAVWQLHLMVANYVVEGQGIEQWPAFKNQVLATLVKILNYATVANLATNQQISSADASNAELKHQLQQEVVQTGCMCLFQCLTRICAPRAQATTSAPSPTPTIDSEGHYGGPSDAARRALELVMFIESTETSLRAIIAEVSSLRASGREGEDRMKNLKLRIALRLTNLLKQAIANHAFEKVKNTLKSKSLVLLGSLSGTSGDGWETIKDTISEVLNSIIADLNASKPANVI